MDLTDAFAPMAMMGQLLGARGAEPGVIPAAVERLASGDFYRAFGVRPVREPADRKRLADLVRERGLSLTYWFTLLLNDEGLSLSALDDGLQRRSLDRIAGGLDEAAECGAGNVGVCSGPDPGPDARESATVKLAESLGELGQAAATRGLTVLLEPFDRGAHKNGLIGPTAEAAALIGRVRRRRPNVGLIFDTAHAALCGEDVVASLTLAAPVIEQIHLANAVLDRTHPRFGDWHMPLGPPGFLDAATTAAFLKAAVGAGLAGRGLPLAIEVGTPEATDPWETERRGRLALVQAWESAWRGNTR